MTLSPNIIFAACLAYVVLLFAVAFWGDRRQSEGGLLGSPLVYTLSLSVYCTSWTFFGAVGSAARNGMEFAAIYLGPTLMLIGWYTILRKMVRIRQTQQITSIADMISSRYGKSPGLAALVTLIAVISTLPYIALQLKAVAASLDLILRPQGAVLDPVSYDASLYQTAFWVAAGMAGFTILFGTRTLDANERHHGVVAAIALEALVKLGALIAVGLFAVFWVLDGPANVLDALPDRLAREDALFDSRWTALTALSAIAVLCLPRMFQVLVVECSNERHLRTASWLFPLYLLLMSLFIVPIAVAGMQTLPSAADPDFFVITLPLSTDQRWLALLVFLGGFS
ncbi:MAG: sodium:solute symporter, partial [Pseudomonadota bacterium]